MTRPRWQRTTPALDYLTPCEKALFEEFLKQGDAILDLGVGGGRTTAYLSRLASRYVGVDYAPKMVAACQRKFPHLEFLVADATNLALLGDGNFDSVVMAFNGMDYLVPGDSRRRCLAEIHRVLKKDGVFIFSSHNPRAVFFRPAWNREKIEEIAQTARGAEGSGYSEPARLLLLWLRVACSCCSIRDGIRAALFAEGTAACFLERRWLYGRSSSRRVVDALCRARTKVITELQQHGFQLLRFTGDDYPRHSRPYVTDWYYYVFQKAETSLSSPCV